MASGAERMRQNARFIRRWAWAISLVLTLIGVGLVRPAFRDPISWGTLITLLLSWLVIFAAVRIAAGILPKMTLPRER
jgi:hypothetical protein